MADQKTFERVCDVIRETAGLDDVEMKPESTLEEIGLDSLGTVEILVAVERCSSLLSAICSASKSPCSRVAWPGLPMPRWHLPCPRRAA